MKTYQIELSIHVMEQIKGLDMESAIEVAIDDAVSRCGVNYEDVTVGVVKEID